MKAEFTNGMIFEKNILPFSPDARAPSGAFRWTAATPGLSPSRRWQTEKKSQLEMENGH